MSTTLHAPALHRAIAAVHAGSIDHGSWSAPNEGERDQNDCVGTDKSYPIFSGGKVSATGVASALGRARTNAPELVPHLEALDAAIKAKGTISASASPRIAKCPNCGNQDISRNTLPMHKYPMDTCRACGATWPMSPGTVPQGDVAPPEVVASDDDDGNWITLNGQHVLIGKGDKIEEGPPSLKGHFLQNGPKYQNSKIGKALQGKSIGATNGSHVNATKEETHKMLTDAGFKKLGPEDERFVKGARAPHQYLSPDGKKINLVHTKSDAVAASDDSDAYILKLDASELQTITPSLPATDDAGQPIHYRRAKIAKCGDWVHVGTGEELPITPERADEWARNTAKLSAAGRQPFLPTHHVESNPDAKDNQGYVLGINRDGDDVYADIALHGDEALKIAARNGRSIYIKRHALDDKGNVYAGEWLHHLALVPNPALANLGGMVKIAASASGQPALDVPVYQFKTNALAASSQTMSGTTSLAASSTGDIPMAQMLTADHLDRIKKVAKKYDSDADKVTMDNGIDHAVDCAEKGAPGPSPMSADNLDAARKLTGVPTLSASDAPLKLLEKALVLAGEVKTKEQQVLSLSASAPKRPDALTLGMYTDNVAAKRELAVKAGLDESSAKLFDAMLADANGMPNDIALSSSGNTIFAFKFWDTFSKLPLSGLKTGDPLVRNGVPALALSDEAQNAQPSEERMKQLREIYGVKAAS